MQGGGMRRTEVRRLTALCASDTRLAWTETECRPTQYMKF